MNFNFFEWIRESVKISILGGVSDAVKIIGEPLDSKITTEKIMGFIKNNPDEENTKRRLSSTQTIAGSKKLGRSIAEIQQ
jgi:hypothetical protein